MIVNSRQTLVLLAFGVAVFTSAGFAVWVRTATVNATYRFLQTQKELKLSQQSLIERRVRWLDVTSPARIQQYAQQLQMSFPEFGDRVTYAQAPNKD